jgi:hypothetical protein
MVATDYYSNMTYYPEVYTENSTGSVTDQITRAVHSVKRAAYTAIYKCNSCDSTSTGSRSTWYKNATTSACWDEWACNTKYVEYLDWKNYHWEAAPKPISHRLREIIQSRQGPMLIARNKPMPIPMDVREMRARETLHRVLGDEKFRRFLRTGFVSVRAKSGLVYQIFPGHGVTQVYRDGEKVERLCVVLRGDFPPTDSLIMRYLLILNDENKFRGYAIKHSITKPEAPLIVDERSLVEIFKEMKDAKETKKGRKLRLVA